MSIENFSQDNSDEFFHIIDPASSFDQTSTSAPHAEEALPESCKDDQVPIHDTGEKTLVEVLDLVSKNDMMDDEELEIFLFSDYLNVSDRQPQSVIAAIQTFQSEQQPYSWTLDYVHGVFGSLVLTVGTVYAQLQQSLPEVSLFSLGTGRSGSIGITLSSLQRVLAGIQFLPTDASTELFSSLQFLDAWLLDENIEAVRSLCNFDRFNLPPQMNFPSAHTNFVLNTHFYAELCTAPNAALDWFRKMAQRQGLLSNNGMLVEILYIPVNLNNSHWILIRMDFKQRHCSTIDPYAPAKSGEHTRIAKFIANSIWKEFGMELPKFSEGAVPYSALLPVQRDPYNCGIYVCVYLVLLRLVDAGIPIEDFSSSRSIHEWRFLVFSWILKAEIFIPLNWLSSS
jgi:hypothetical protein